MAGCLTNCSDGDHFLSYNFDDLYNSLLGFTKTVIGESMESTIHEFKYANDNQNFSNFVEYYLPKTGVCFHFNYLGLVKEAGVGEENGMELLIRLNSDPNLREGIQEGKHGLTLTIQRPLTFPTLTLNRLDLEPGMAHLIPLNRGSWNFKKNCISNWSQAKVETFKKKVVIDLFANIHYDQNVCKHYCQLESIYQKCGCVATEHEILGAARQYIFLEANGNLARSCLLNDSACTTTSTVADPESTCGCILSCTEVTFDILHSQGKWPADGSWKQIAKRFGITRPIVMATDMINFEEVDIEKYTDFLWRRKVDTSVMKINIFIRSKESLEFSEKDKYQSYWEFLAKMGGSMSVFMGLSFVAVIEVWGTYLVWIWSVVSCKMSRKKKTKELFN
ncbi:hypothetical protein TCAL_05009 [Tigriopus californicus]|uniref:Uncharacterized protein n=1 Tax=Tigriopus californicus TaxID=6832 RepID=A0A553PK25_TIGCA|nr:uncharacterized protein LOC131890302 [Tigriopus californicus]TRY78035.1 hypothetical protein TCAL_05009 [Tigriopus californicus]